MCVSCAFAALQYILFKEKKKEREKGKKKDFGEFELRHKREIEGHGQ